MGCGASNVVVEDDKLLTFAIHTPNIYRSTLSIAEQELYDFILEGYRSYSLTLDCSLYAAAKSRKSANRVNQAILLDHPEIFHTFVESISVLDGKSVVTFADFNFELVHTKAQQIYTTIDTYFKPYYHSQMSMGRANTDLGKVQIIIEWLLSFGRYEILPDTDMSQFTIEGFFLRRKSACEGFAKAYQLLCAISNIEAICVRGDYSVDTDISADISVFSATPRDPSVHSARGVDRFDVQNDVSHRYDHIYGEREAFALDAAQKQHSEGVLAIPTNMTMTLSSIHRPDSLGTQGPMLETFTQALSGTRGQILNSDNIESFSGLTVLAEDGELLNKRVVSRKNNSKKQLETVIEDTQSAPSTNLLASQVLRASTRTTDEENPTYTALGNSNVISFPSKAKNLRHTWSMTKLSGVWYHTDVILCLRGMVDAYIPSAFLRMSTAIVLKMGLNIMNLIKVFSVEAPSFTKNTCILNDEKTIVADILRFLLARIGELKASRQAQNIAPDQRYVRSGVHGALQADMQDAELTDQSTVCNSIYASTLQPPTSTTEARNPLWNHISMCIGETTGNDPNMQVSSNDLVNPSSYGPALNAYMQSGQAVPDTVLTTADPVLMQSNYEQWKTSRLTALQTAFISESSHSSINPNTWSSCTHAKDVSLQSYAEGDQSVFSAPVMAPSSGPIYQSENPVIPYEFLATIDSVLTFEFVFGLDLDWSTARRVVKGKMPFISLQLRNHGVRVGNYTVEKFLATITLEECDIK